MKRQQCVRPCPKKVRRTVSSIPLIIFVQRHFKKSHCNFIKIVHDQSESAILADGMKTRNSVSPRRGENYNVSFWKALPFTAVQCWWRMCARQFKAFRLHDNNMLNRMSMKQKLKLKLKQKEIFLNVYNCACAFVYTHKHIHSLQDLTSFVWMSASLMYDYLHRHVY